MMKERSWVEEEAKATVVEAPAETQAVLYEAGLTRSYH